MRENGEQMDIYRTCIFTILFTMKKSVIDTIKKILTNSRFDTQ